MNHENVVSLVGVIESENKLLIVSPLFELGSLRDYVLENNVALEPATLAKFTLDVAKGCEYVASLKIVHRDIAVSLPLGQQQTKKTNNKIKTETESHISISKMCLNTQTRAY